jgi:hypothetical protein
MYRACRFATMPGACFDEGSRGQGKVYSSSKMMTVLKDLRIPIRNGRVHFYETFSACIKRVTALTGFEEGLNADEEEKAAQRYRTGCLYACAQ